MEKNAKRKNSVEELNELSIVDGSKAEKQHRDRVEQGYYCNTAKHYNRTHCKSGIGKLIRHTSYNIFNPFKAMVHYRKC